MTSKRILRLDASAIVLSGCERKLYYTALQGYTSVLPINEIEFGSAFHKFLQGYYSGLDPDECMNDALKYYRSRGTMKIKPRKGWINAKLLADICVTYQYKYPLANERLLPINISNELEFKDGNGRSKNRMVELKFAIPYRINNPHYEVLLCGTWDMICSIASGGFAVVDHKTTSVWDSGPYLDGYKMSCQFLTYLLALKWYAREFPKSIYGRIMACEKPLAFIVNGIFLKAKSEDIEYIRSTPPLFYSEDKLVEFESLLKDLIDKVIFQLECGDEYKTFPRTGIMRGMCIGKFGPCEYFDVCHSESDEERAALLEGNFERREYNPLNFGVE